MNSMWPSSARRTDETGVRRWLDASISRPKRRSSDLSKLHRKTNLAKHLRSCRRLQIGPDDLKTRLSEHETEFAKKSPISE